MLLILLALFLNFSGGQMQSDYQDIVNRVITHESHAQNVAHEVRTETLHSEQTSAFDIAAPPPKIQVSIAHENIKLKPKISDVFSHTIDEITQEADQNIGLRASVGEIKDEGTVNVIKIAAPPPKIQLNIKHETLKLQPKISGVIGETISGITGEAIQGITSGPNIQVLESNRYVESPTVIKVAAPPPKIQLNIKHETIKLQPKISGVISQTYSGITEEATQGVSRGPNIQVLESSPYERSRTVESSQYEQSPTVINIAAPPPKIRLNIRDETVKVEHEANVHTEGSVNVIDTAESEEEETYERSEEDNTIETEPDSREAVKNQKIRNPPHKLAHKKGGKKPAHTHGKHKKPKTDKALPRHKQPKRPVKKTHKLPSSPIKHPISTEDRPGQTVNINPKKKIPTNVELDVEMIKQELDVKTENLVQTQPQTSRKPVNVVYKLTQIAEEQREHGPQEKPLKKPMKRPPKSYEVQIEEHIKIGARGRKHFPRPRGPWKILTSMKRNRERHPHLPMPKKMKYAQKKKKCAQNKCTNCVQTLSQPKRPTEFYVGIKKQIKFGRKQSPRPRQPRIMVSKIKKNWDRHLHLSRSKKIHPIKMKHGASHRPKCNKSVCKTCHAKLRMNMHVGLKHKAGHGHMRISAHRKDIIKIAKRPRPALKIMHEKHVRKSVGITDVLATNRKLLHKIRILKNEKMHLHASLKKCSQSHHVDISAHKRVQVKIRHAPARKRVVKECPCKFRMKRHIPSETKHIGGESGIFYVNPAANVNVLRPKRYLAERLKVPKRENFVHSKLTHTSLQSHDSRSRGSSAEIEPSDSSRDSTSITASGLQFDSWQAFGTCEYTLKGNARTYDDAETECQKVDAHLVSIHSEPENDFIGKITSVGSRIESIEDFVWIGLRMNSQNQWEWVDGSPLDYKKWAENQPDHPDKEKCAQLYQGSAKLPYVKDYHWNSYMCDRPMKYYVCKRCKRPVRVREHSQG